MPIFKYGSSEVIEAIVDGLFESLPLISIDGFTGGLGDVQIPAVGIDGFTSDISGDISLPPLGVTSYTETATGAFMLLRPGVSGSAYEETYAQFYLPKVGISGGAGAEGSASLGLLEFSGNAVLAPNGDVGINLVGCLGAFGASGDVEIPWDIDGVMATESHVWLRRVGVSGYSGVGSFADVDVNLILVGVYGECFGMGLVSGTVEIPVVSLNGMTGVGVAADGEVALNVLDVAGDASTGVAADGEVTLSSICVDGLAEHSQYANGIVHLMSYGASGLVSLYIERVGSGTVSVSRIGVSGLAFSEMIVAEGDDEVIRYSDDRRLI